MIADRDVKIDNFLSATLQDFQREKLPSDASFRKYERISSHGKTYILMDAPPEKEDVKPFIKIDEILIELGLSAPKIIARDIKNGFLLLEDMGNRKFNSEIESNKNIEEDLYKSAVDVLVSIYEKTHKTRFDINIYDENKLLQEANLFTEWYLPLFENYTHGQILKIKSEYEKFVLDIVRNLYYPNNCLVLRDYHADNLMILKNDELGLLDFQDALIGNPAYDLVSLLEDARRDVPQNIQKTMINYFIEKTGLNEQKFLQDYYILGAQRNLKILGIFSRLKVRDNKDNYLKFIPRVKNYLKNDLQHPVNAYLKNFLNSVTNIND